MKESLKRERKRHLEKKLKQNKKRNLETLKTVRNREAEGTEREREESVVSFFTFCSLVNPLPFNFIFS